MTNQRYRIFLSLFSIVAFSLYSCKSKAELAGGEKHIAVQTAKVIEKSISLPIFTSGKVYSSTESKLSFTIPGIIAKIHVNNGQYVTKNTRLAELNLIEMKAKVDQAGSARRKAERDLARVKRLFADSVTTLEQLQNATTALDIATSDLEIADFNLRHATIYAPENGRILKKFAEEGELIGSGTPVFLYGSSRNGWVIRAGVTDVQIVHIQLGDKAQVTFDPYPEIVFEATVTEIEAIANPYTGTFEVELQLEAGTTKLFSGFVGRVKLMPALKQTYSIIPVESLIEGDEKTGYVFEVDRSNNSVKKHQIKIAQIADDQLLVLDGLENIEEVVTHGTSYLTDGSLIKIINN